MALHKTSHDGLSRCDPNLYSNLYDTRQRPELKNVNEVSVSKDTIEINRDKIKEDALSRLRHNSKYTIAQSGFMRVGKYLFVAFAFPPYFVLYRIPKLVFAVIIPTVFNVLTTTMGKMKQKIKKPFETVAHRLSQSVSYMQVFARILIQPVARIFFEAKQALKRMHQQCLQLFRSVAAYSQNLLTAPLAKGKNLIKTMKNRINRLAEQVVGYTKRKTARFQEGLQGMKEFTLQFLGWGNQLIQKFNALTLPLKAKLGNRYVSIQQKADFASEWIFKQLGQLQRGCKGLLSPTVLFWQNNVLPRWARMKTALNAQAKKAADFFKEKHRRALAYLEEKQEKIKKLSYPQWVDQIISSKWLKWLPGSLQQKIYQMLHHPSLVGIWKAVFNIYSLFKQAMLHLVNGFLLLVGRLSEVAGAGYGVVRKVVRTGWGYCSKVLSQMRKFSLYYFSRMIYYTIFTCMVFMILVSWGLGLIAQMATKLLAKLPLSQKEAE
jgi:hypothetical protein